MYTPLWTPERKGERKQRRQVQTGGYGYGRTGEGVTRASQALDLLIGNTNRRHLYAPHTPPLPFLILFHLKGAWPIDGREKMPFEVVLAKAGAHANSVTTQQRVFSTTLLSPEMRLRAGTEWVKMSPFQLSHTRYCFVLFKLVKSKSRKFKVLLKFIIFK